MAGRRRRRSSPGRTSKTRAGARYFYKSTDVNFNALGAGDNISGVLVDRSAVSGTANSMTNLLKVKIQWHDVNIADERSMLMAVARDEESLGSSGWALDSVA